MAETLAAIALLDPAIKLGRQIRKSYKIQASFGKDFRDYKNHFDNESVLLEEILKTPVPLLSDEETRSDLTEIARLRTTQDLQDLLGHRYVIYLHKAETSSIRLCYTPNSEDDVLVVSNQRLNRPNDFTKARQILETLTELSKLFDECTALIESYTPAEQLPGNPESSQSPARLDNGSRSTNYGSRSTTPPATPVLPSRDLVLSETLDEPRESIITKTKRKLRLGNKSLSRSSTPVGERDERIEGSLIKYQRERVQSQELALQTHVDIRRRVTDWRARDAEIFRGKIHRIQNRNMFLERLIVITNVRQRFDHTNSPHSARTIKPLDERDAGPFLAALQQIFIRCIRPNPTTFVLRMMESYRTHAEASQRASPYLGLVEETRLMPVMALSSERPKTTAAADLASMSRCSNMQFAVARDQAIEDCDDHGCTSWTWTSSNEVSERPNYRPFYHKVNDLLRVDEYKCTIFQRFPPSTVSAVVDLKTTLADGRLRESEELYEIRYHLAYATAAFFMEAQSANIDIRSLKIMFFLQHRPADIDPEDLALQLREPYLTSLDYETRNDSIGSLQNTPETQGASVQKLGVLLHEIGTWRPITDPPIHLHKAIELAKSNAPPKELGLKFHKALQECLDWQDSFSRELFEDRVLQPLKDVKTKFPQPSKEMY